MPEGRTIRNRVPWASLALAVFFCAPLAAQNRPLPPATGSPAYAEFTDEVGRKVRLAQPVRRIVSLAPSLTETIYELGAQDRLVADTDYCDYPEEARAKPKVGGTLNPSIEEIAALHPDLVLLTKGLNRYETLLALEQLAIPVYATDPHSVEEMISSSRRLAEILGVAVAGRNLAQNLEQRLNDLSARLAGLPAKRVLFVVWADPLISTGRKTFVADALRRAGAESIIETDQDWPQVSLEEVVRLHPDFIVFPADHAQEGEKQFNALAGRPVWRDMDAVKNHRIAVASDAISRPAPRMVSAIEDLARQLHPEAFAGDGKKLPAGSFRGGGAG